MRIVAYALVAGIAASASAHETWIMPSSFTVKPGEDIRFDVSSGMAFPQLESPIRTDRVARAMYRLGPGHTSMKSMTPMETSLSIRQKLPQAGVATVWLDLDPKEIVLDEKQVAEYLDEIGATDELRSKCAARKDKGTWKETYTKHAKTFVVVGEPGDDRSWAGSVGSPLEIVPVTSPFEATAGGEVTVELRVLGTPLAGLPVGVMVEGSAERVFRTTGADGRVTLPAARVGRALIFAVRLVPADDGSSWRSNFSTMTFAIRPN